LHSSSNKAQHWDAAIFCGHAVSGIFNDNPMPRAHASKVMDKPKFIWAQVVAQGALPVGSRAASHEGWLDDCAIFHYIGHQLTSFRQGVDLKPQSRPRS